MKQSLSLSLAVGLVAVRAQAPASLPQCGQTCVNNMLAIAVSDFGCDANDLASCACCNVDFGFGIRDCSREVCGDGSQDYSSVVAYGSSYCASAVTSCPSGTQASSVLATATTGGSGSGTSGGSGSGPAMTSGPLAGAVGAISAVSGSSNAYVVGSTTITAGGDAAEEDDTAYTALPSGAGVLVSNGDAQTTYVPGAGAGGASGSNSASGMTTSGAGGAGGLGAAAGAVSTVSGSPNQYVVGSQTISAGGDAASSDGTTYTALPSQGGVEIIADGSTTTANPASGLGSSSGSSSGGSGGGAGASSTSGGSGGAGGASESSGGSGGSGGESSAESGNFAPIQTAAPALIGAAAMVVLAL